ncbi:MAG: type II toxin-antitoxin system YoeB family toxin [Planctomycetaceae bacterium]|jgi:toxin YoeB|nr:type II toxin-antitoxin system YoeB family toxin [Planctomycetaceae bacterium]
MNKLFTERAWDDYLYWIETDKKQVKRINTLIREIVSISFRFHYDNK